jgi:hypothetical protein
MNYGRSGKMQEPQKPATPPPAASAAPEAEQPIRVDGYEQVLAMLRIADREFRESLLRRLAARDRQLADSLRAKLGI